MKVIFIALSLTFSSITGANDLINLSPTQVQALGIRTIHLASSQQGQLSGLPAQVVVPGHQLRIISTPLPALVEQVLVGVGDAVRKGQPLIRLQSATLIETQRGLLQASVQAQLTQENLTRDEQLWKDGIISESRYRVTRGQQADAAAALTERKQLLRLSGMSDSAIKQLQTSNLLSSALTLTAPMDGTILEKSANVGQHLDAAMPVFKIAQLNPLALEIQAPLSAASSIRPGARISLLKLNASGKVTAIGRSLSGSNQTILLRGEITQGAAQLRPGQFVEANIDANDTGNSKRWTIPSNAVVRINGESLIFVQSKGGFLPTKVTLISEAEQSTLVAAELRGDELIAVQGVSSLKAQMMGIGGGE